MSQKRPRAEEDGDRPPKRSRAERQPPPAADEIHFARQLQELLTFNQDGLQQLRHGILSFKTFLESILYHKEEDDRARQISILREYLDSQKPSDSRDYEHPILSQLWQAWSFANQNHNDYLASSISSVLALLLKTLSEILDLRDYGILIGRTVLQNQHLRLIKRCLDAPKEKDFIISPCLRLLTEVVCFDGGVLARDTYKHREQTFDFSTLRKVLSMYKTGLSEEDARRRPAVRTHALRYVLALLKHLHEGGKVDVLKNRVLCNAMFSHLRDDPPELANDLLTTFEQSVLKQDDLPRSAKAALLAPQNLDKVKEIASWPVDEHVASAKAFAWLKAACTNLSYGILRTSGWYPPGTTKAEHAQEQRSIDLGLDSLRAYDEGEAIQVRNSILLTWIRTLRPQTDPRERELLLACFNAAPELVAAYFSESKMQLDPKLTNTWIGYASLVFEVIRLPIPAFFGNEDDWAELPPQPTIVIENILPQPLTVKDLTRCLNQGSDLITFFAVQILVLAFEKIALVRRDMAPSHHAQTHALWLEASERLVQSFASRCPPMKDVILCFKRMLDDDEHVLQREAVTHLLQLYYEVLPMQALEEQFDISASLTTALLRMESHTSGAAVEVDELRTLELERLLSIAKQSPGMRWFSKQGGLVFSPIVTLLKIHRASYQNKQMRALLGHVLAENNILRLNETSNQHSPLDALVASVARLSDDRGIWFFVDDCIGRATRKPVKYLDDLATIAKQSADSQRAASDAGATSLLAAVVLEQTPFVISRNDADTDGQIGWAYHFLELLAETTDEIAILQSLKKQFLEQVGQRVEPRIVDATDLLEMVKLTSQTINGPAHMPAATEKPKTDTIVSTLAFAEPPVEPDNHPELVRVNKKDVESAMEDGDLDGLMLCLCSQHPEIRRQAANQLRKVEAQLRSGSGQESNSQIALLIGELWATFAQQHLPNDSPLPYLAGTFAVRALHVQMQPTHSVYPKLNEFLIRGPEWRISRLPGYWVASTILSLPEEDDAYWREVQWVLDWLVDGLRTPEDMSILRKAGVFEKMMAFSTSPGAAAHKMVKEKVFELLFRATCVEGGSDMLVMSAGALAWMDMVDSDTGRLLRERILSTCNKERIRAWSGGMDI